MPMIENTLYICLHCFKTLVLPVSEHRKPNTICMCNSVPQVMAEMTREDLINAIKAREISGSAENQAGG